MNAIKLVSIALLVIGLSISSSSKAQSTNWRIDYHLSEMSGDFGQGVMIETPSFLKDYLTFKLRGNVHYLNHDFEGKNRWTEYFTATAGISSTPTMISKSIELYGEGGVIMVFPNSDFSNSDQEFGGYGLFGFNFLFYPGFSYFIEAGGVGTGSVAELSDNERIYANGFFINVGFKMHFVKKEN